MISLELLDKMHGIVTEGLTYAKDDYERARYLRLQKMVNDAYSEMTGVLPDKYQTHLWQEVGCITPKLGVDIVLLNELNKILIVKRSDDGLWCLPCGWVDVGETPLEAAKREVKEETGLRVNPDTCIAITSKGPSTYPTAVYQTNILLLARHVKGEIILSHEHSQFRWIDADEEVIWHPGHERFMLYVRNYWEHEQGISLAK